MENIIKCNNCESENFSEFLKTKDFFLSQEVFTIVKCNNCGLLFVNPRPEIEHIMKYYQSEDYISHSYTSKNIIDKIYKLIRTLSHFYKYNIIKKYCKKGTILDIGCATGEFLYFLRGKGWETLGVEPNEKARVFAQTKYKLKVLNENEFLNIEDNFFDVITLWHVLEHFHNPLKIINHIYKILKKNGTVIVAIPNPYGLDAIIYKEFWAGFDLPRHLFHFSSTVLVDMFKKSEFEFIEKKPMYFDSFYISLLSEQYKYGKKNFLKSIFVGTKSNYWAKRNNNEFSSQIFIFKKKQK